MINIKELQNLLSKAGLIPNILVLGGWIYSFILVVILLYNLFFNKTDSTSNQDKEN